MTSLVVKFATEWHNYNIYHKISGSLDTTCSCTQLPDLVEGDSQVYSLIIIYYHLFFLLVDLQAIVFIF